MARSTCLPNVAITMEQDNIKDFDLLVL